MRIVAGRYKGIQLNTFEYDNIRPTPDKVREAVFSKIQFDIVDSVWLDLFGGTGAVGLEALSRGASKVSVCDDNKDSQKLIQENYNKCKLKADLIRTNYLKALKFLSDAKCKFDYIYLDPPFRTNYGIKAIGLIATYDLLNDDGMIIYEHLRDDIIDDLDNNYSIIDTKYYGSIAVTFIRKGVDNV